MTPHVVIAGGGVGALEGLLALQALAGERVDISVLTATRHLTYRALSVAEPFGSEPAQRFDWEAIARDRGVRWIPDVLEAVRPGARELDTRDGPPVHYDSLLLAVGARPEPALAGAVTFAGPPDVLAVKETIEALAPGRQAPDRVRRHGRHRVDAPALRAGADDGRARAAARPRPRDRADHPRGGAARHLRRGRERRRALAPEPTPTCASAPARSRRSTRTAGCGSSWRARSTWTS